MTFRRRRKPQAAPVKRMLLAAAGILIGFEATLVGILQAVSIVRRKQRPTLFPHDQPEPVMVGDNRLLLHAYGQHLYDDMLSAIDSATETIYLETFIWKGDETGQRFKDALIAKANQGVDVYVMYDHFANLVVPPAFKEFPASVHVLAYRAWTRPWHPLDPRHYALDHRKIMAVDGKTAFIGGYNIGTPYATTWRDTHLRVDGPDAADVAHQFAVFWNREASPEQRIQRIYRRRFNPTVNLRGNDAAQLTFPIRDMYLGAIDTAFESIRLTSAYFVPDSAMVQALISARQRGAEVKILVPWVSNHVVTDWLARGYFERLLSEGVRIFAYRSMLHAKVCTIDGQWSTVGTANLDRLSQVGNYEINMEIYSPELAGEMEQLFEHDLQDAREITLESWQDRPWYARLSERLLEPLRGLL